MKVDSIKAAMTYAFAFAVLAAAFYGLVLYEFSLDDLVKGALIAWGGTAIAFVFTQETAKQSASASSKAFGQGLNTTPANGMTVTTGDAATATISTTPAEPTGDTQ